LDILIKNATVVDGSGAPRYEADIVIAESRIIDIGPLPGAQAELVIDAAGYVVSPGFIDMHSHADLTLPFGPTAPSLLHQGITTAVVGQCGLSPAPLLDGTRPQVTATMDAWVAQMGPKLPIPWSEWSSFGGFLDYLRRIGISLNIVPLVGQGMIRSAVMGFAAGPANPAQICAMQGLVMRALEEGAFGISTGLIYPPGSYASTAELIEVTRPVGERGGFYFSHIRGEGETLLEAVSEAVRIGRESGAAIEVGHFKATGRANWSKLSEAIAILERARGEGLDVTADTYPYAAGSTTFLSLLPEWAQEGGRDATLQRLSDPATRRKMSDSMRTEGGHGDVDWQDIMIGSCPAKPQYQGHTVAQISAKLGRSAHDVVFDVLLESELEASMFTFQISPENIKVKLRHPAIMIGTDSFGFAAAGPMHQGIPHPRNYGVYPRLLGRYVREERVLSLEEAVWKASGFPARKLRLSDRGLLKKGYRADLVIFDPGAIIDRATFQDPHQYPAGIAYVIVNGQVVVHGNVHTGTRPGQVLSR